MIPLAIDTVGSLALAAYVVGATWRLCAGARLSLVMLQVAAGIRLGLTFKVAATLLALSAQPGWESLARVALLTTLRLLIRFRTADAAERLAATSGMAN